MRPETNLSLKIQLDKYVEEYETKDFICSDPIQFPHRYKDKNDIEISAFISSMFAFGRREVFISKLNILFDIMENKPFEFIKNFDKKDNRLTGFNYRFAKDLDLIQVCALLSQLYSENETLESLFSYSYSNTQNIKGMLQGVVDYFYSRADKNASSGFCYLLPDPKKNSAVKRLNMLLRWLVRDGEVDLGLWNFVDKSELLIPLDTHVAKLSRQFGLLNRNSNDFQSVIEVTNELKKFDPIDPVKYDFALFGYGVNN